MEAQSSFIDNSISDSAYAGTLRQYHTYVAPEVGLYRGIEYVDYSFTVQQGQPFLGPNSIRDGSVWYNGIRYDRLHMMYDLIKEQLVILDPFDTYKISLYMDLVDSFALDGNVYFRIRDSLAPSSLRSGYCDRIYQGRLVLLKKERKTLNENFLSVNNVRLYIESSVSYYAIKDGGYHPLNTKREIFDLLKDRRRSDIKRVMRKSNLEWPADKEQLLKLAAAWYDGVNH
jgi:hypothetical protein